MKQAFYITVLIIICFSSCAKNKRRDSAAAIVKEWTGKVVEFPSGIPCTFMGIDTTCVDLYGDNFKIVLYVDSTGCSSCRLKLFEWKKIMLESDSVFARKPEFIFFFQPKKQDERELQSVFRSNGFQHPVFIDRDNEINRINKFPSNPEYQCFLLDKDNKVLLVGNPAYISGIWILYKRVITESESKLLTMEKGGEFTLTGTTTLPPFLPPIRKEAAKITN